MSESIQRVSVALGIVLGVCHYLLPIFGRDNFGDEEVLDEVNGEFWGVAPLDWRKPVSFCVRYVRLAADGEVKNKDWRANGVVLADFDCELLLTRLGVPLGIFWSEKPKRRSLIHPFRG